MIAGLVYAKGISIIHLSLIFGWLIMPKPDWQLWMDKLDADGIVLNLKHPEGANKFHLLENCEEFVTEVNLLLYLQLILHVFAFFSCLWDEIMSEPPGME